MESSNYRKYSLRIANVILSVAAMIVFFGFIVLSKDLVDYINLPCESLQ